MSTPRRVEFCENSTISEAWSVIMGLPGPVDDTESPAVLRRARASMKLEPRPSIVTVRAQADAVHPFWNQQVAWQDGELLARFGHRYISVHFVRQGENRYSTFDETLFGPIGAWLDAYEDGLGPAALHSVDRIGFGYVNRFAFPAEDFDLSNYFQVNVGVDIGAPKAGLLSLNSAFRFYDEERNVYLTVELSAEPREGDSRVDVTTKLYAERRGIEGLAFGDRAEVISQVRKTKEAAKETFFSFATDKTHSIMKVVRARENS